MKIVIIIQIDEQLRTASASDRIVVMAMTEHAGAET
jgi:hypothetical protein